MINVEPSLEIHTAVSVNWTCKECDTASPTSPGLSSCRLCTEKTAAAKTSTLPRNSMLIASHLLKRSEEVGLTQTTLQLHHHRCQFIKWQACSSHQPSRLSLCAFYDPLQSFFQSRCPSAVT